MKIKLIPFKKDLIMPVRAHYNDAGIDCFAQEDFVLYGHGFQTYDEKENAYYSADRILVSLGFGLEIPDGYVGLIKPRSSMNIKGIITSEGILDSGYKGEIKAYFINTTNNNYFFKKGDKICQIVIEPVVLAEPVLELGEERGEGGFGSTDKKGEDKYEKAY